MSFRLSILCDITRNNRGKIEENVHRADRAKGRDEKAAWQNMIAALNHMRFFSHASPEKNATVLAKLRDMDLYIVRT